MSVDAYSPESAFVCPSGVRHDHPRNPQSFASLFDINRQTIALLIDAAATRWSDPAWLKWRTLGNELAQLDIPQRESLVRCPFSLIDVGLGDAPYLSTPIPMSNGPTQGQLMLSQMSLQSRLDDLAHAVFLLAWHLVRSDKIAARLVFAMDSVSTSVLTQVTLTDIRWIAQDQVCNGRVHPRWHRQPEAWSRLILTARSPHCDVFANVTTRGLQLFLQELVGTGLAHR
jgi:hypothetical protein